MARRNGKRYTEYLIYIFFWGVLLMSPFFGAMLKDWSFMPTAEELFAFWGYLAPALVLFFVNNNILMPFLLYKKKGRLVVLYLLCIIVACTIIFISFPMEDPRGDGKLRWHPEKEMVSQVPGPATGIQEPDGISVRHDVWMFFTHPKNTRLMLVLFVLVFNVCVRLFFFTLRRDEEFKELEQARLKTELDYLKFQVNPHFFMNSLNNIHALVDVDKDRAQKAIVELSKMMRHLLYDASELLVPLEKELAFLYGYIDLMRLRYTDKVKLNVDFPKETNGVYIPPLLLLQFVENAFKHGVTYKKDTVIDVSLKIDRENEVVLFACSNTYVKGAANSVDVSSGGIGVENARKRLELLFGAHASMDVRDNGEIYKVVLKIPYNNDKVYNS